MKIFVIGLIALACFDLFQGGHLMFEAYWKVFGLSENSTAYDYNSAPTWKARTFEERMCNDGVCLTKQDWACGFSVELSDDESSEDGHLYGDWNEAVVDCFWKVARNVEVWTRLDKIRMICGRRFMSTSSSSSDASPEKCKTIGGQWEKRQRVWGDEDEILKRAGVNRPFHKDDPEVDQSSLQPPTLPSALPAPTPTHEGNYFDRFDNDPRPIAIPPTATDGKDPFKELFEKANEPKAPK
jgi:hypothetical protein